MDKDIKDLIIFGSAIGLSVIGALKFNDMTVLMAGLTGAFAFLGIRRQEPSAVQVAAPVVDAVESASPVEEEQKILE